MSSDIKIKYGDFVITYDEDASQFVARSENPEHSVMRGKELGALKTRISNLGNEQGKRTTQPKQKAFCLSRHGDGYRYSISQRVVGAFGYLKRGYGSDRLYAWVSSARGRDRERVDMSYVYGSTRYVLDTKEHARIISQILKIGDALEKYVQAEKKKQAVLLAKLKNVEPTLKKEELPVWER